MDSEQGNVRICEIGALSSTTQNQSQLESTILTFLKFPDSPLFSNSSTYDRVLHDFLASHSGDDDDSFQDQLIDRTLKRVLLLLESTKSCFRKRLTLHNSISWFLPSDLTIKVFSMLDTKSLMQAAACCTMFSRYAMDPLCYSHIDLTTLSSYVDDGVLRTMIHRAGKELRSLKLGSDAYDYFLHDPTSYCLDPLSSSCGFNGNLLRSLHIYHLGSIDMNSLSAAFSSCSNLTDLKIVGLMDSSVLVLELLSREYRLIEHLFLENLYGGANFTTDSTIDAFVTNCPNLTSLTQGFNLNDAMARILVKGFHKLKYMDLSTRTTAFGIDGSFLRDLGYSCENSPLETLILQECSLKEKEVLQFLNSLIEGDFRFIRYIDVSRNRNLAYDEDGRTFEPNFPLEKLYEERPELKFVAEKEITPRWNQPPFDDCSDDDNNEDLCYSKDDRDSIADAISTPRTLSKDSTISDSLEDVFK